VWVDPRDGKRKKERGKEARLLRKWNGVATWVCKKFGKTENEKPVGS
jgi:hypothetical protein